MLVRSRWVDLDAASGNIALEHASWALHGLGGGARLLLMLHTFADESHDSARADVLTVAGVLAPRHVWDEVWRRWAEVVKREQITAFHATDCETANGEFKGWSRPRIEALQRELIAIAIHPAYELAAWSCSVSLPGYEKVRPRMKYLHFPSGLSVSGPLDDPYFILFQFFVQGIATDNIVTELPAEERVGFTFDQHHLATRASAVYEAMQIARDKFKHRLGGVSFLNKAEFVPLQVADLFAYETYRYMSESRSGKRPTRWQYTALKHRIEKADYYDLGFLERMAEQNEAKVAPLIRAGHIQMPASKPSGPKPPPKRTTGARLRGAYVRWSRRVRRWARALKWRR
jgi:hypothetical protein